MANFNPPFASTGDKRLPSSTERNLGFPCGPADQALFNQMHFAVEAEIGNVISYAGIAMTSDRYTQLREAITALIAAATGAGDTTDYLLMSQARARLPIMPEVLNIDGRIVVTQPATGTVRLPGGVTFLHRGVFPITTAQQDFTTVASKTYHLRWDYSTNTFRLRDLADIAYNPTTAPETNNNFDSSPDSMLVARVITSAANVATITNLSNLVRLEKFEYKTGPGTIINTGNNLDGVMYSTVFSLNWARYPMIALHGQAGQTTTNIFNGFANRIALTVPVTRYDVQAYVSSDFMYRMENPANFNPYGSLTLTAFRY
jgi:hypothetical protein